MSEQVESEERDSRMQSDIVSLPSATAVMHRREHLITCRCNLCHHARGPGAQNGRVETTRSPSCGYVSVQRQSAKTLLENAQVRKSRPSKRLGRDKKYFVQLQNQQVRGDESYDDWAYALPATHLGSSLPSVENDHRDARQPLQLMSTNGAGLTVGRSAARSPFRNSESRHQRINAWENLSDPSSHAARIERTRDKPRFAFSGTCVVLKAQKRHGRR